MKVYFSHTGLNNLINEVESCSAKTVLELVDEINQFEGLVGIKNEIISGDNLSSSTRIFGNIVVDVTANDNVNLKKYYEKDTTIEITNLKQDISEMENILISIFEPKMMLDLINSAMTEQDERFEYIDKNGMEKLAKYKPMIDDIDFDFDIKKEEIYEFKTGECTLDSLTFKNEDEARIVYNGEYFNKSESRILPEDLSEAIADLWGIEKEKGRLRLFQEDSLFYIMSRLLDNKDGEKGPLLLSMPTGGGKTEAFMIPLLANIYRKKEREKTPCVKSIVIYPTNALANDQAARFVEMIYKVNQKLSEKGVSVKKHLSIGIMTGDTPRNSNKIIDESLIQICPKCGKSEFRYDKDRKTLVCDNILEDGTVCNTTLSFCRLTKNEIVDNPPDILITNPDTINYALQSPLYSKIFRNKIDNVVFDEIHVYQGIFGCHIAHLLRRLEECMGHKPLYIGLSATIGNAKELAALLFDESLENVKYIKNENNQYMSDVVNKERYHVLVRPYLKKQKKKGKTSKAQYVRTMSVAGCIGIFIGHLITDSHFRKSIIFTNYRSEADDLAGYLKERERLDTTVYFNKIIDKIVKKHSLDDEYIEICQYMKSWYDVILNRMNEITPNVQVGWNRGGLEKKERINSIHSFCRNNILNSDQKHREEPIDLMVATKSLEVGIDIGDVTTVINSSAPYTVNEYVQRVGRAGRKKDSLAITVVNPENAIDAYVMQNFDKYVYPNGVFEDAPIIINNEIITKRHIAARIADIFVEELNAQFKEIVSVNPTVDDIMLLEFKHNGNIIKLKKKMSTIEMEEYCNAMIDRVMSREVEGIPMNKRMARFLNREAEILNTKEINISEERFNEYVYDATKKIIQDIVENKIDTSQYFSGFGKCAFPDLLPSLRGAGATVGLYIQDQEDDSPVDVVSRQTAFNQMPLSGDSEIPATTKSGISTFKIEDCMGENDKKTAGIIMNKLFRDKNICMFYMKNFEKFPYSDDLAEFASELSIEVINNLNVSYFPTRFYCDNCKVGLIVKEDCIVGKNGVYCKKCGHKAQQLHRIYTCVSEDDNGICGKIYDPKVPKICFNPKCNATKKAFEMYKKNGYSFKNKRNDILGCFKFRLTKDLEWVCCDCGNRIDFSSWKNFAQKSNPEVLAAKGKFDNHTIEGFCGSAINYPEKGYGWGKDNNKESYGCVSRDHKKRKSMQVPRVRTIAYSYIGNSERNGVAEELCNPVKKRDVDVSFSNGFEMQLAEKFIRRFSTGMGDKENYQLKNADIFKQNTYWGNYYESHLAWISFKDKIDDFIKNKKYSCDCNCSECKLFDKLDLGEMMRPCQFIEDYNYDSHEHKPKKPDHRRKFCQIALDGECDKKNCEECEEFSKEDFLRYIITHTLKHGILWALPKYAGVGISEIKGEVYPNDSYEHEDLVLIDSNEGGSGAIMLIQKHWDEIWDFAKDVIKNSAENKANIILPHTCSRFNADLCPFVTKEFLKYLETKE